MPGRDRVRQGDRDLAQGDAPGDPAVLAGRADAAGGGLLIGSLVHDQDRVTTGGGLPSVQLLDYPVRSCVQHRPVVAAGAGQQVLHPARAAVPGSLGEGPAVVIVEFRQQAVHHATAGQPRLPAGETRSDPCHQVIERASVPVMTYRGRCECCVPQAGMITAAALTFPRLQALVTSLPGQRDVPVPQEAVTSNDAIQVTIYNCRNCRRDVLLAGDEDEDSRANPRKFCPR